jgi:DNA-binding NarL/FixJ family response regulator
MPHVTGIHWARKGTPRHAVPSAALFHERLARVVLVDDHRFVLDALTKVIAREPDLTVVATATSLAELAELAAHGHVHPDVVLLDYSLPDGTGVDACRLAKAAWPHARVVILTGTELPDTLVHAIEAGADGYLVKSESVATVLATVRAAAAHELLLTPAIVGEIARRLAHVTPEQVLLTPLTPRELTVLKALALGHSTGLIASDLGLSQGTVRVYIEAIRRKFHVSSRLEAVSAAVQHHIVEVPYA